MGEKPKRRWFRFRISTVLILTAILAWAMATRPYIVHETLSVTTSNHASPPKIPGFGIGRFNTSASTTWGYYRDRPNPNLVWPAFALAAFLASKGASTVVERRRRQSA